MMRAPRKLPVLRLASCIPRVSRRRDSRYLIGWLDSSFSSVATPVCTAQTTRRGFTATVSRSSGVTAIVALSGGVDSSVVAALVQQQQAPQSVHAIHMSNWNTRDDSSLDISCSSDSDWNDAQAVAKHLHIDRLQRLSFEREYWIHVWEPFVSRLTVSQEQNEAKQTCNHSSQFLAGSFNNAIVMGNPDMDCNKYVKFGALQQWCRTTYGDDGYRLVTGHYARLYRPMERSHLTRINAESRSDPDGDIALALKEHAWVLDQTDTSSPPVFLATAKDASKDQSYFLAACNADSFNNVVFPLGECLKNDGGPNSVRAMAQTFQLPTATKRDSTGICFVGRRRNGFREFVQEYMEAPALECVSFVDIESGAIIGKTTKPDLACLWTIGQGAKIGGSAYRYFVAGHEYDDNDSGKPRVLVCRGTDHPALFAQTILVQEVNWVAKDVPDPLAKFGSMRAKCRIRHLQPLLDASLNWNASVGELVITFDEPVRGVTRGQFAAIYVGALCFGGGEISQVGQTLYEQGEAHHQPGKMPATL